MLRARFWLSVLLAVSGCDVEDVAYRVQPGACLPDADTDNDGLLDEEECELGTDPADADSDGDGVTDLGEVRGTGTDPLDPGSTIPEGDFFVVLPFEEPAVTRPLRFDTRIQSVDVFLLVDASASMAGEKDVLQRLLLTSDFVPELLRTFGDPRVGVGALQDYPVNGYGRLEPEPHDLPFVLLLPVVEPDVDEGDSTVALQISSCPQPGTYPPPPSGIIAGTPNGRADLLEALETIPCGVAGGDTPQSYTTALYLTATGEGVGWPAGSDAGGTWEAGSVPAATCAAERFGYACFRSDALPVVLLVGDAPFHQGPAGAFAYDAGLVPMPPSYDDAVTALEGIGARVLGLWAGAADDPARADFEAVARDTGAVLPDGTPVVIDVGEDGSALAESLTRALGELAANVPQDVTTEARNSAGNPDDFDATRFIAAITPVEGYRGGVPGARPGISYASKDATAFYEVIPGTRVEFAVEFVNDARPPPPLTELHQARIVVLGNGVALLDERRVYVVVPAAR